MKKILSLILVIAILASFGIVFASAEKKATITASGTEAVYENGDFVDFYFTIDDPDNQGKDWVGIYPVSKVADINNISMAETIGWWTYVDGDKLNLRAELFKLDWSKYEFEIGGEYYGILFENDGYKALDFVKFTVAEPAKATQPPKEHEVSAATEAPKATEEPVATEEVKATEEPVTTEEVKATEAPAETEEAKATAIPTATEEAKATEAPTATEEAKATEAPEKKGCGSSVACGASIVLAACVLALRKKEI